MLNTIYVPNLTERVDVAPTPPLPMPSMKALTVNVDSLVPDLNTPTLVDIGRDLENQKKWKGVQTNRKERMKLNMKKNKRRKKKAVGKTFEAMIMERDEIPPLRYLVAQTGQGIILIQNFSTLNASAAIGANLSMSATTINKVIGEE